MGGTLRGGDLFCVEHIPPGCVHVNFLEFPQCFSLPPQFYYAMGNKEEASYSKIIGLFHTEP